MKASLSSELWRQWAFYSLSQLPAPRNPKVHLYNAERVLSWEPVSLSNDSRPVVYQVQYKYASGSQWYDFSVDSIGVNCMNITTMECDFTPTSPSQEFLPHLNVSLRVRAKVGDLVSTWVRVPWFQYLRNVTVGPPENVWVTPGEGSLVIRFSSPFDISPSSATFLYYVHYWEKGGIQKVKGPFRSNSIVLNDLKPLREYCLQVKAQLVWTVSKLSRLGHLSNVSCYETAADATTKLQQIIIIAVGIFLLLLALAGACFFLVLKYKGLIKYWFHSPPTIPLQIEEYLKDPSQPILEALDKDSSPKDDAWDSVSIVSFPEKEREDVLQSTLN
ncbi:interferon gamma receptor 2 isoform X4 [Canis lupus baileyi]|uniref:Interferon gamma receptor 2 n=2 Tax=Canis lupus TaxID=9612 RepID=A0A8C0TW89_CANLF|nr:interferon gamma receptor 2 isoform X3 [Canis lupus familiaris]XP_025305453.1 interferon gamma receptor 2 isoform X3 [Canis lupus dingo]XP_038299315.1 interferon gamma receptor 2 isoform X3 [Canis lupus familiaris]XP_038437309.1 interferon gamma receptor 2 isoform X3 [Canis lupus familiaris]|eukprot:XP_005638900.1 interferon gamma receptor 2 isoform X4 [Canis lupus familiaris]